ncbi:MAG TPA: hypothetical protein VFV72_01950 [Candidatus Limnocylindrales bacterium]|nr:hypothetical protein [Candidatus Limnocylindrales bacterium]
MNAGRDVERLIADWFVEEAVLRAPDRILEDAGRVVDRTKQRRFGAAWRNPFMSAPLRVAAAAVLGVLVLGGALIIFKPWSAPVGGPTSPPPSATPSAEPSPSPSGELVRVLPESGRLEPGRYVSQATAVDVEFTVGSGWTSGGYYVNTDTQSLSFWNVPKVYADACDLGSAADTALGGSVDDLVAALDNQANTDMSSPVEVTIDGHRGVRVELSPSSGRPESCSTLALWTIPDGGPGRQIDPSSGPPDELVEPVWIVDVDGARVVFVAWESKASDHSVIADVIASMTMRKR